MDMHFPHNKKNIDLNLGFENHLFFIISKAIYAFYSEITHLQASNDEMVNYPCDLYMSTLKIRSNLEFLQQSCTADESGFNLGF